LLGYSESELIGRDWFELAVPPDTREELRAGSGRLMASGTEGYNRREGYVVTRGGGGSGGLSTGSPRR
jgi:PAS domain S-box-containing protein